MDPNQTPPPPPIHPADQAPHAADQNPVRPIRVDEALILAAPRASDQNPDDQDPIHLADQAPPAAADQNLDRPIRVDEAHVSDQNRDDQDPIHPSDQAPPAADLNLARPIRVDEAPIRVDEAHASDQNPDDQDPIHPADQNPPISAKYSLSLPASQENQENLENVLLAGTPIHKFVTLKDLFSSKFRENAKIQWIDKYQVLAVLRNSHLFEICHKIPLRPPSGSIILFNTNIVRKYNDGYEWKMSLDGRRRRQESYNKLSFQKVDLLRCYCAQPGEGSTIQRKRFRLLDENRPMALVHYLDSVKDINLQNDEDPSHQVLHPKFINTTQKFLVNSPDINSNDSNEATAWADSVLNLDQGGDSFKILDICPNWGYASIKTKVLIVTDKPIDGQIVCQIERVTVPVTTITASVFRIEVVWPTPEKVAIMLDDGCSPECQAVMFEIRPSPSTHSEEKYERLKKRVVNKLDQIKQFISEDGDKKPS